MGANKGLSNRVVRFKLVGTKCGGGELASAVYISRETRGCAVSIFISATLRTGPYARGMKDATLCQAACIWCALAFDTFPCGEVHSSLVQVNPTKLLLQPPCGRVYRKFPPPPRVISTELVSGLANGFGRAFSHQGVDGITGPTAINFC